ncbi:UNVERIFIED_CONTAM: hypothetical protein GTU68_056873 [Idotea baltica]|nr:hypothetical protein [Idotea baltica]
MGDFLQALELTKSINCVTEFIPEAEAYAELRDRIPENERGPLHGLPVSVKENVEIQGMDTTLGLGKFLYCPASSNANIVELLIKKGAVPFCKTNVPQMLLSFCCSNPVYGETLNPHDLTRTPGGSSGGEAALIGGGGSVLGIGSDLAGSARVPSSFSGCVGLRPTYNRLSSVGLKRGLEGQTGVVSTVGVMGRDVEIVATCMKALTEGEEMCVLDPTVVPLPWNELNFNLSRKLVFGYFDSEEIFPTTPGVKRAVLEAKIALEKAGHEVKPYKIPEIDQIFKDELSLVSADGGVAMKKRMNKEVIDKSLGKGLGIIMTPPYMKPLIKSIIKMLYSKYTSESIQCKIFFHYLRKLLSNSFLTDPYHYEEAKLSDPKDILLKTLIDYTIISSPMMNMDLNLSSTH